MDVILTLCKEARNKKGEEADTCYSTIYTKFDELQKHEKTPELLINWAMALSHQAADNENRKDELLKKASAKFDEAQALGGERQHYVHYCWGKMLLEEGCKAKKDGVKPRAEDFLSQARAQFSKSIELKADNVEALYNLSQTYNQLGEVVDGNSKMWCVTQAAEADRMMANLRAGGAPQKSASLSPESKLAEANKAKEKGNEAFKANNLQEALRNYHSASNFLNGLNGLSAAQEQEAKALRLIVHNNFATVLIKQNKTDRALVELNKALVIDPANVKALFRRGKLRLAQGDTDKARDDLKKAQSSAPDDKDIKQMLVEVDKLEKKQGQAQKDFYGKMFA